MPCHTRCEGSNSRPRLSDFTSLNIRSHTCGVKPTLMLPNGGKVPVRPGQFSKAILTPAPSARGATFLKTAAKTFRFSSRPSLGSPALIVVMTSTPSSQHILM